jgi:hypothetical protein
MVTRGVLNRVVTSWSHNNNDCAFERLRVLLCKPRNESIPAHTSLSEATAVIQPTRNMPHNHHDVEDSRAGERTPMLEGSSHQRISGDNNNDDKWTLTHIVQLLGGGIYAPDPSTYDPIKILLNAEDEAKKDELTMKWRDNKLSELSFVGVVVCMVFPTCTFKSLIVHANSLSSNHWTQMSHD